MIFRDRKPCVDGCDLPRSEAVRGHIASVRSPSDGQDLHLTWAMCEILRSTRSSSDGSDDARLTIGAHDRGSIVARSLRDRGPIAPRSGLIYHEIEATIIINGSSRSHDRSWPSIRLHDRIKQPKNRTKNSSLKTCISLLCS